MDDDKRKEMLTVEDVALKDVGGILEAMETVVHYESYTVTRNDKNLFSFRIRSLDDEEVDKCRDLATKTVKDRRYGSLAVPKDFNAAKFNSLMIYTATHPDDRKILWDNKDLWQRANITTGWQLVDKVLNRGEKEDVLALIERLSGYNDGESTEDTLKNS